VIQSFEGHSFLVDPLAKHPVVLDLGANYGSFSAAIATRHPGVRIVGAEPVPDLHSSLPEIAGAVFHQVAVSGERDRLKLFLNPGEDAATLVPEMRQPNVESIDVDVVTLDDLLADLDGTRLGLIKMDIEGAETAVLLDSPRTTLKRADQISVEFHDFLDPSRTQSVVDCEDRLTSLGFDVIRFSRDNSNVLFVNTEAVRLGLPSRLWVMARYVYLAGSLRILRRGLAQRSKIFARRTSRRYPARTP
jgi:FkbM family methyltransferase